MISDAPNAGTVRDALSNSGDGPFKVEWVRSRADGIQRLTSRSRAPAANPVTTAPRRKARAGARAAGDLVAVLVDLYLPDSSGLDTFAQLFRHTANLHDVTSGTNGQCNVAYLCAAVAGYDGPTGLGTPNGIAAFGF